MDFFSRLKERFMGSRGNEDSVFAEDEYVELDTSKDDGKSKVIVRPFLLENFDDVKPILDSLRDGSTIAIINIRPLKDRDIVELKRAVNKIKKTTDAIEGEIAGFGEDYIVATPSFAEIYRSKQTKTVSQQEKTSARKDDMDF